MQAPFQTLFLAVLALATSLALGQVTQCGSGGSPQLRFVTQLNVSGCALFVHDTGTNDGPHLAVEPVMCVTEHLQTLLPQFDPVAQQTYVSVPVILRDDAMLLEVQHQLRHLSPKSVKFATVTDINVSTESGSKFQVLGFMWSPDESVGFLRLGHMIVNNTCSCSFWVNTSSGSEILRPMTATATIASNDSCVQLKYRIILQNESHTDLGLNSLRYSHRPWCQQLQFIRSIRLLNCAARVHQKLDMTGHILIEPLLCHNVTSMGNESVGYDYSRDMHYLKLDVVLQDNVILDFVRTQLADLSPRSVTFMRLWRAQSVVASALSRRFEIGSLMVSGDWRSAQLRVYCQTEEECLFLGNATLTKPVDLWRHVRWFVTSQVSDQCLLKSRAAVYAWKILDQPGSRPDPSCSVKQEHQYFSLSGHCGRGQTCKFIRMLPDGRKFAVIQQRLTGNVSFQRTWNEYERGFGDETDFWIGLSTIHSLSINGATLRVEAKLWDGTQMFAEYAGFKVGDASTNYLMTYHEMLYLKSNIRNDALEGNNGMQFSTMDRDYDRYSGGSCSNSYGKGGWWFRSCHENSNANGKFPSSGTDRYGYIVWETGSVTPLREVRLMVLMLQIG